ncbi:MAG TPA: hypothetical protein VFO19_05660 [Vicinamibacterales bacterium]|nr:hypothetical protein [Vicinamibacterales bacterium]
MSLRLSRLFVLGLLLAGATSCNTVNLATDLEITEVQSGWFDAGIDKDTGWNHLVPSISFRLKNKSSRSIVGVQLTVSIWLDGDDGEKASKVVRGIGGEGLAPGAETEPIVVRTEWGYNLEGPRASLFENSGFRDGTAKIFGQRAGRIVRLGEYKLERKVIYASQGTHHP